MNYNTLKCQEIFCNRFIGDDEAKPFSEFKSGKKINEVTVLNEDITNYKYFKKRDMASFYYKSLLSYAEGVSAISRGNFSWATIKLYYSVYYGLRCSLLCRNVVMVRANRYLYYFKLENGAVYKRTEDPSDHGSAIKIYSSLFKTTDFLCSNYINETISYNWMKQCREIVNYRDEIFHDPNASEFWEKVVSDITERGIKKTINAYIQDKNNSCFSTDTAVLAIPTYRILATAQEMRNEGVFPLAEEQRRWVISILKDVVDETIIKQIII